MKISRPTPFLLSALFCIATISVAYAQEKPKDNSDNSTVSSPQVPKKKGHQKTIPPKKDEKDTKASDDTVEEKPIVLSGMNEDDLKAYDKLITKDAKTQKGVFLVHQIKDKIYWEVPKKALNRLFLWQTELAGTPSAPAGFAVPGIGVGTRAISFERHNGDLWMRDHDYSIRSSDDAGLVRGLAESSIDPIIQSFPIKSVGKGDSLVIDVTDLFMSDPANFAVKSIVGGLGVDPSRSAVTDLHAFPKNIETTSMLTFEAGGAGGSKTVMVHYSLDLLPKKPMEARLADSRIGFFSQPFTYFGSSDNEAKSEAYINRFRLIKKNPDAPVSDPVKPIVFYISREVPAEWRPYLKKSVEAWQPVFEKAGFSNAIIAKDAPTEKEDPSWSPDDARYSVIRWAPSTVENAMGPSIQDPRSGETLSGHMIVWHNVLKLAQTWYFSQASASDPSAQKLPLPNELLGRILTYIVTHEVGHVLGLEHNFKASSEFPVEKLRDPAFTAENGDEASVMDYGRFNYVAQPGDGATLIPKIGPYDYFAIKYGYMPATASTPEGERHDLDNYLSEQVSNPFVRFGNSDPNDPGMESEDLGDDPVKASTYGFKNIDRVAGYLLEGTTHFGKSYQTLDDAYNALIEQRFLESIHVTKLVGGVYRTDYHGGRGGDVFAPASKQEQSNAVQFLVNKSLNFPSSLLDPAILNKINSATTFDTVISLQKVIITTLLAESRLQRMFDNESMNGSRAYTVSELTSDLQSGVWGELHEKKPVISLYKRVLQQQYLSVMDDRLNGAAATQTQFAPIARLSLMHLQSTIDKVLLTTTDSATRAHLLDSSFQIKRILEGKKGAPTPTFSFLSLGTGIYPDICGSGDIPKIEGVNTP